MCFSQHPPWDFKRAFSSGSAAFWWYYLPNMPALTWRPLVYPEYACFRFFPDGREECIATSESFTIVWGIMRDATRSERANKSYWVKTRLVSSSRQFGLQTWTEWNEMSLQDCLDQLRIDKEEDES